MDQADPTLHSPHLRHPLLYRSSQSVSLLQYGRSKTDGFLRSTSSKDPLVTDI